MDHSKWQANTQLKWLTLFISSGTLICCALPILLVSLGFGAVVASLNYNVPGLLFLAEQKLWTLGLSALLLLFLAWVIWRPNQSCPVDPIQAENCQNAKTPNIGINVFFGSVSPSGASVFSLASYYCRCANCSTSKGARP